MKLLQIFLWVIFIDLYINADGIAVNTCITCFINPPGAENFRGGENYLSHLYQACERHFSVITLTMIFVAALKAIMFYPIVKPFAKKKLDISQPFSTELRYFILNLSYLVSGIGLFSYFGYRYAQWFTRQTAQAADQQSLHIAGADIWLLISVIFFVIVQIVKRGIEIQNENDLTI